MTGTRYLTAAVAVQTVIIIGLVAYSTMERSESLAQQYRALSVANDAIRVAEDWKKIATEWKATSA